MDDWRRITQGLQAGDESALRDIVEVMSEEAVRWAYLWTGDRHVAEELAQEAFLRVWQKRRQLRDPAKFRG